MPVSTSYKCFHRRWEWNEWLKLPLKYSDLPRYAVLSLSLFDCVGGRKQKLATTEVSLFSKKGIYREGQVDLQMVPVSNNEDDAQGKLLKFFFSDSAITKASLACLILTPTI